MIIKSDLQLTECTPEEYADLKIRMGLPPKGVKYGNNRYAKITRPLVYPTFKEVLERFKVTPSARRASAHISKRNWFRKEKDELTDAAIAEMCRFAEDKSFLYVAFKGGENNEIGFEIIPGEEGVISASLAIPGEDRDLYEWIGSDEEFFLIQAIYEPKDVGAYAQARRNRRAAVSLTTGSKSVHEASRRKKIPTKKKEARVMNILEQLGRERRANPPKGDFIY